MRATSTLSHTQADTYIFISIYPSHHHHAAYNTNVAFSIAVVRLVHRRPLTTPSTSYLDKSLKSTSHENDPDGEENDLCF